MNKIFIYAHPCSIKWHVQFISAAKFPSRLMQVPFFKFRQCSWRLFWTIQTLLWAFEFCLAKFFTSTWVFWLCLSLFSLSICTLTLLSCSPNFPHASITRYTHAKHKPILNYNLSIRCTILELTDMQKWRLFSCCILLCNNLSSLLGIFEIRSERETSDIGKLNS